jgi:hypothetical protein
MQLCAQQNLLHGIWETGLELLSIKLGDAFVKVARVMKSEP